MEKHIYGLVGRVNVSDIPIMERGRFAIPLNIPYDDNDLAIAKAERIFWEKVSKLNSNQSIMGYVHKDGTLIHTFYECCKRVRET